MFEDTTKLFKKFFLLQVREVIPSVAILNHAEIGNMIKNQVISFSGIHIFCIAFKNPAAVLTAP